MGNHSLSFFFLAYLLCSELGSQVSSPIARKPKDRHHGTMETNSTGRKFQTDPSPELRLILLEGSEKPIIPALSLHLSVSQNRWQPPSFPCEDVRKQMSSNVSVMKYLLHACTLKSFLFMAANDKSHTMIYARIQGRGDLEKPVKVALSKWSQG